MHFARRSDTRVRRVAVVFHHSLMLEGLVTLLGERADLEVTRLDPSALDVPDHLRQLSPDVIVVDGESARDWPSLALTQLLADSSDAKVIDVNLDSTEITVYEQHKVTVGKFDDLLEAFAAPRLGQ